MDVNPNKSPLSAQGIPKPTAKKRASEVSPPKSSQKSSPLEGVKEDFALHEAIRASLDAMPEVRRNLVETGRELANDENYPSAENLDELSSLALKQFVEERQGNRDR